jgi:hypothetical protein
VLALAYSWHFVLFSRFIDRVGKGLRTSARDALIASSIDKQHWGKNSCKGQGACATDGSKPSKA